MPTKIECKHLVVTPFGFACDKKRRFIHVGLNIILCDDCPFDYEPFEDKETSAKEEGKET